MYGTSREVGRSNPDGRGPVRAAHSRATTPGVVTFARFALPPNQHGFCGPSGSDLGDYLAAGTIDGGLVELAGGFDGAWPYLELIAQESRLGDPLDRRVVEAYWLGGPLATTIDVSRFGESLSGRFSRRTGWRGFADGIRAGGGAPTHAFHVFCVYPWLGLLRSGLVDPSLGVLDRCRIRWGRVVGCADNVVTAAVRPLVFEGGKLALGSESVEASTLVPGLPAPADGSVVALHWDWVCAELTPRQAANLAQSHENALRHANSRLP